MSAPTYALLEAALYVDDLEQSEQFYRDLLGTRSLLREDRLYALQLSDRRVLLLFRRGASVEGEETPGGSIPGHDSLGTILLAFETNDLPAWEARLSEIEIAIESVVTPAHDGRSVYFRDPDGHLVEFADRRIWDALPPID